MLAPFRIRRSLLPPRLRLPHTVSNKLSLATNKGTLLFQCYQEISCHLSDLAPRDAWSYFAKSGSFSGWLHAAETRSSRSCTFLERADIGIPQYASLMGGQGRSTGKYTQPPASTCRFGSEDCKTSLNFLSIKSTCMLIFK